MPKRYFDNNATTPITDDIVEVMKEAFLLFGNPSSQHKFGHATKNAFTKARLEVASLIGCESDEIIFTSSGTEANNFALKGYMDSFRRKSSNNIEGHVITSNIEHPSVLEVANHFLEYSNIEVTHIPVDSTCIVHTEDILNAIRPETKLISIMLANNETGTIQPIKEIAHIAKSKGIFFHCDAVQGVGKIPVDVKALGVDALSLSGHKFNAPKGVGALYLKAGNSLSAILHGGGQEKGLRGGTENITSIVGMGYACKQAKETMTDNLQHMSVLKSHLLADIKRQLPNITVNGAQEDHLFVPNTLNLSIHGIRGEALMTLLSEKYHIAISTGSACSSNKQEDLSHVLKAMGLDSKAIRSTVRISFGPYHDKNDINYFSKVFCESVVQLRSMLPT